MRMLCNPEDAADATQEILILIVTKLSTFRGESSFHTWSYRVAANYLLTAQKIANRESNLTFDGFRRDLEDCLVVDSAPSAVTSVMLNELRVSCTMAMLLCLNLKHRIAYVLGDILEFEHDEAAKVLEISKGNYRKRLSRARKEIISFTSQACGLASDDARCTCPRRLPAAKTSGRLHPNMRAFVQDGAPSYAEVMSQVKQIEGDLKVLVLQTAMPHFKSPVDLGARITEIVQGPN